MRVVSDARFYLVLFFWKKSPINDFIYESLLFACVIVEINHTQWPFHVMCPFYEKNDLVILYFD